jgi:hypothetical protein
MNVIGPVNGKLRLPRNDEPISLESSASEIVSKNLLPIVATTNDMVNRARIFDLKRRDMTADLSLEA